MHNLSNTVILVLLSASGTFASAVYTYTGVDFTTTTGPLYTTSDYITGIMTLAAPLVINQEQVISPVSFQFSDQLGYSITNLNATFPFGGEVTTDSEGSIINWQIEVSTTGPIAIYVCNTGPETLIPNCGDQSPGDQILNLPYIVPGFVSIGTNHSAGTWALAPAPAPEPSSVGLISLGALVAWARGRKRAL
jgi:hypothetical protein